LVEQYRGLVKLVDPASVTPAVTSDPDDDQVLSMGKYQGIAIISAAEGLRRVRESAT
jgi:hypothetical protein